MIATIKVASRAWNLSVRAIKVVAMEGKQIFDTLKEAQQNEIEHFNATIKGRLLKLLAAAHSNYAIEIKTFKYDSEDDSFVISLRDIENNYEETFNSIEHSHWRFDAIKQLVIDVENRQREVERRRALATQALAKLTPEEREALDLPMKIKQGA